MHRDKNGRLVVKLGNLSNFAKKKPKRFFSKEKPKFLIFLGVQLSFLRFFVRSGEMQFRKTKKKLNIFCQIM
jgi:hypothetical protein